MSAAEFRFNFGAAELGAGSDGGAASDGADTNNSSLASIFGGGGGGGDSDSAFTFGAAATATAITATKTAAAAAPNVLPAAVYVPSAAEVKSAVSAYAATDKNDSKQRFNSLVDSVAVTDTLKLWKCNPLPTATAATAIESSITALEAANCDVLKDVYEGGFKVWEGCTDMLQFLSAPTAVSSTAGSGSGSGGAIDFTGRSVLCLGCGHGLVGIYALLHGARTVCFQDLNASVLRCVTLPNLILNAAPNADATASDSLLARSTFVSGDWGADRMIDFLRTAAGTTSTAADAGFDIVLSEDTVYYTENYPKLLTLLRAVLRRPTAKAAAPSAAAYFSAKCYYFGNGGGTTDFVAAIQRDTTTPRLGAASVRTFGTKATSSTAASGNVREILRVAYN